jgi:predicted nuclease of predicted toxin-antitoxin system
MDISPTTVACLNALGHEAVHLADQGLERLPDSGIVAKARPEERILLVNDLGFGELVAASEAMLPSVITFRLRVVKCVLNVSTSKTQAKKRFGLPGGRTVSCRQDPLTYQKMIC